jgi:8-oxo-dGTP pyrophosphatase MutT (NUDIX family)
MPTQILYGPRLGKEGKIRVGCSAIIFNNEGKFLLTRRADNGQWCLPSGGLEPGESVEEACIREIFEETGLNVGIKRLIGVYSNRDQLVIYDDGARFQIVALHFEAEITGGTLGLSNETTDFGYFALDEIKEMDLIHSHRDRIQDSQNQISTIVK